MNKTVLRRLLALALCICIVLAAAIVAGADFGDFSGDSDYGSSDWDSSSVRCSVRFLRFLPEQEQEGRPGSDSGFFHQVDCHCLGCAYSGA